jgi:hypothetical protein
MPCGLGASGRFERTEGSASALPVDVTVVGSGEVEEGAVAGSAASWRQWEVGDLAKQ